MRGGRVDAVDLVDALEPDRRQITCRQPLLRPLSVH
jgi:hypothetical protein